MFIPNYVVAKLALPRLLGLLNLGRASSATTLFLLIVSCGGGCERLSQNRSVSVIVEPVKIQESSPIVTVPGLLIPRDRIEVKVPYAARISEVFVNKGDKVAEGTVLAKLSDEEVNLKLNQLRAAKKEAETLLEKNSYLLKNRERLLEEGKIDKTQYDGIDIENANADATLNRIKTDIAVAEYNAAHLQINSPSNGVIVEKYASPMLIAGENQILFVIINTDPILVSFPLTADESLGIQVGTPLKVRIEDLEGEEFNATVTHIGTEVHQISKTFEVFASIANPDQVLKANMQATAEFTSTNIHKVFVVPTSAIIKRDRDRFVFTVSNGIAHQTKVTLRNVRDDIAEVSSGLAENDLIVAKGAQDLQDGAPVDMWRR